MKKISSFVLCALLMSCSFNKNEKSSASDTTAKEDMNITKQYGAQNETYIEGWEKKTSKLLIYKRLCKI